ncbi:hypothetical protein D3C81_1826210 [compost metagenome]
MATMEAILITVPVPRATKPGTTAYARRINAVTLRLIIASMSSTGLPSSDMTPPTPALLTNRVMLASLRRICSTRSESALFFRSATTTSTVRPVWSLK